MTTLKFTIIGRYEADPDHYGNDDLEPTAEGMAALDQDEFDSGGISVHDVIEWAGAANVEVRFRPDSPTTEEL